MSVSISFSERESGYSNVDVCVTHRDSSFTARQVSGEINIYFESGDCLTVFPDGSLQKWKDSKELVLTTNISKL